MAFHEVGPPQDEFGVRVPEPGKAQSVRGVFSKSPDLWLHPDVLETLQHQYRLTVWTPEQGQCYWDWETLFLVWYYRKECHFDSETQLGLLLSSQPTKRQSTLARQSRDERLAFVDHFLLIRSYDIQVSNPFSPSTVFTSLGQKGSLTGDVGPDEWYDYLPGFYTTVGGLQAELPCGKPILSFSPPWLHMPRGNRQTTHDTPLSKISSRDKPPQGMFLTRTWRSMYL